MPTVNIHKAKTELSRLIEAVESGEAAEIIIARNGKPAARLVPLAKKSPKARIGFLKGELKIPDDFDEMGQAQIADLFGVGK
ncbi:MAG: type II toxin-antitoxin system Phd/YefM family antitoxin [Parvularculaceae bacterium]|nr:type II toxin-antitoxin system Phd/YefM family antitoxin [Parvularculaceae bacterium]